MRKLRLAIMALSIAVVGALAISTSAHAGAAANYSKIPDHRAYSRSDIQNVAWVIYVRYYNGCQRQRWCRNRYWNGYKYLYSSCYWGSCYGGGGYRGGGGGGY